MEENTVDIWPIWKCSSPHHEYQLLLTLNRKCWILRTATTFQSLLVSHFDSMFWHTQIHHVPVNWKQNYHELQAPSVPSSSILFQVLQCFCNIGWRMTLSHLTKFYCNIPLLHNHPIHVKFKKENILEMLFTPVFGPTTSGQMKNRYQILYMRKAIILQIFKASVSSSAKFWQDSFFLPGFHYDTYNQISYLTIWPLLSPSC